jgi:hypothetical protein
VTAIKTYNKDCEVFPGRAMGIVKEVAVPALRILYAEPYNRRLRASFEQNSSMPFPTDTQSKIANERAQEGFAYDYSNSFFFIFGLAKLLLAKLDRSPLCCSVRLYGWLRSSKRGHQWGV